MTLLIELPPEAESALEQEAQRRGVPPEDCARLLLTESLRISRATEKDFQREMVAAGLMSEVTINRQSGNCPLPFEPIKVTGKPVSETIVEERR